MMNKTFRYFELIPIALDEKPEKTKNGQNKAEHCNTSIAQVSAEFFDSKDFIEEHLEQKCLKENIYVEEVIYLIAEKLKSKFFIFYCIVSGFKGRTCFLTSYIKEYNI